MKVGMGVIILVGIGLGAGSVVIIPEIASFNAELLTPMAFTDVLGSKLICPLSVPILLKDIIAIVPDP